MHRSQFLLCSIFLFLVVSVSAYPLDNPPEDPPAAGDDANQPAAGADANEPAAGADADQPAAGADADQPAAGDDANQPAAGADADQPAAGADANQPAAGANANQPAAGADANQPAAGADANDTAAEKPSEPAVANKSSEADVTSKENATKADDNAAKPEDNATLADDTATKPDDNATKSDNTSDNTDDNTIDPDDADSPAKPDKKRNKSKRPRNKDKLGLQDDSSSLGSLEYEEEDSSRSKEKSDVTTVTKIPKGFNVTLSNLFSPRNVYTDTYGKPLKIKQVFNVTLHDGMIVQLFTEEWRTFITPIPTKPGCNCITRGPLSKFKLFGNIHFKRVKVTPPRYVTLPTEETSTVCPPCPKCPTCDGNENDYN